MAAKLRRTVVLVGMMGAGKTAIGTQLAKRLGVPFVDSDAEIVRAANLDIPEIFSRYGEAFFRDKEAQVLKRLLVGRPQVLATGGGAFLAPDNRAEIAARAVSVWLKVDLELLWQRVRQKTTRPLLRTENPKATLAALIEARTPIYALADLTVEAQQGYSVEKTTELVVAALTAQADVLEGV